MDLREVDGPEASVVGLGWSDPGHDPHAEASPDRGSHLFFCGGLPLTGMQQAQVPRQAIQMAKVRRLPS